MVASVHGCLSASPNIPQTPGFANTIAIRLFFETAVDKDWSQIGTKIDKYPLHLAITDWAKCSVGLEDMARFVEAHLKRVTATPIRQITTNNIPVFDIEELESFLIATGTDLKELHLAHARHETEVGVHCQDMPRVMQLIVSHASQLESLTIPIDWSDEIDEMCVLWPPVTAQGTLQHLTLRINKVPRCEPVNLVMYLSSWMATGARVSLEWNDFSLPRKVFRRVPGRSRIWWGYVDTDHIRKIEMQDFIRNIRLWLF
jgi:hypothetical protein